MQKYEKIVLDKEINLFNAEVINFPKDIKKNNFNNLDLDNSKNWKLYDKSSDIEDGDQLRAVTGICFMLLALVVMGLYSSLV